MQCLPVPVYVKYTQNITPVRFGNFNLENLSVMYYVSNYSIVISQLCMYVYVYCSLEN